MKKLLFDRNRIERALFVVPILYIIFFTIFLFKITVSWDKILLSVGIIVIQSFRFLQIRRQKTGNPIHFLMPVAEYVFIILLFYGTGTNIESLVFAIFTLDIIFSYESWFGVSFAYAGFAAYLVLWGGLSKNIIDSLIDNINYCVFIGVMWGAKVLLKQRDKILLLNRKMLEQSSAMEDLAKLKERNRIAEEVHNSVGHKLTVAIVSLEGAHLLFGKNPEEAHEKLNIARKQLKDGLNNIREVIRAIHSDDPAARENSLITSVEHLIRDVEMQMGIRIHFKYDLPQKLLSLQEHVLINAVKEGITNAIKHARTENIHISLIYTDNQVELVIANDGKVCRDAVEGFGLKTIRENAEAIGGNASFECDPDGFTLSLHIPVVEEN